MWEMCLIPSVVDVIADFAVHRPRTHPLLCHGKQSNLCAQVCWFKKSFFNYQVDFGPLSNHRVSPGVEHLQGVFLGSGLTHRGVGMQYGSSHKKSRRPLRDLTRESPAHGAAESYGAETALLQSHAWTGHHSKPFSVDPESQSL